LRILLELFVELSM